MARPKTYDADARTDAALAEIETVASNLEQMVARLREQVKEAQEARARPQDGEDNA